MVKILLLAFAIWLVIRIVKTYKNSISAASEAVNTTDANFGASEDMVQCAHCGVHLPKKEGFLSKQQFYCSEAHISAHQAQTTDINNQP